MKPPSTVTIKDVARVARVHFSTVSLALRDHPSIPDGTRARIRQVAERVGYQPSAVLSALSRFRRRDVPPAPVARLAYLVNRPPSRGFQHLTHQQHLLAGAQAQAQALGYTLDLLFIGPDHHDATSLAAHLQGTGTTGLIIGAFEPGLPGVELDWPRYSVVKIDSRHVAPAAAVVSNDQLHVVRLAFQRLVALGYRRIGLAVGRADEEGTDHRHAMGYLIEQAALPGPRRVPPLLFPHHCEPGAVAHLFGPWIRRHRVDAVLCNWLNVDQLLASGGWRVPDQVACACLCLLEPLPHLAGVLPNLRAVGAHAVSVLAGLLRAGERGVPPFAPTTYVSARWQDGASAPGRT